MRSHRTTSILLLRGSVVALLAHALVASAQIVTPLTDIDWLNPAGWSTGRIPGGSETPQLSTGTVTVTGAVSIGRVNLFGGTLTNPNGNSGTLTLTATGSDWRGSSLNSSAGGNLSVVIGPSADFLISTTADHDFNGSTITNHGTVNWTAGNLRSGSGGVITNHGVFNDAADAVVNSGLGGTSLVFTNAATGNYSKTSSGTTRFDVAFNNDGTTRVTGGTLQLNGGGTNTKTFTTGPAGAVNVSADYALTDGSVIAGTGAFKASAGTFTVSGNATVAGLDLAGATLAGTQTFNGALRWTGGNWNSAGTTTLAPGSTLSIAPDSGGGAFDHDFNGRAIVNNGTVNWQAGAGQLRSGDGGTFTNNAAFNDSASSVVNSAYGGTSLLFTNSGNGTYTKLAAGTTRFDTPFNNDGSVVVNAGTLQFNAGGTNSSSGTLTATSNTTIVFSDSYSIANGSSLLGAGTVQVTGGTFTVTGNVNVTNFQVSGGALAGTQAFNGNVTWNGGVWNGSGTTTIGAGSILAITPTSDGSAFDHDFNGRAIVNNGTVNWQAGAGQLRSGGGGTFTNNAAFNDSASSVVNSAYGGASLLFTNSSNGTYTKSATGTTRFDTPFDNNGSVVVNAGTLQLNAGGTNSASGGFNVGPSSGVLFSDSYTIADGSKLLGAGTYQVSNGTFTVSGNVAVSNFLFSGGTLAGSQTFNGGITWDGGIWNGPGTTTIGAGSTLSIAPNSGGSAFDHDFNGHAIVNNGTVNWQAGSGQLRSGGGGTFTNNAAFNDSASSVVNSAYGGASLLFTNSSNGTYTKSATGTTRFDTPFNNDGSIVVHAGTFQLNAGGTNSATGTITTDNGALTLFTDSYTVADGSALGGLGTYQLAGGTFTVSGNVSVAGFFQTGGVLAGTHSFTGNSTLTWNAGTWNSSGNTTISAGSTLSIATGADHDFNGRGLINNGTVNWAEGRLRSGNGGTITNNGVWNDSVSSEFNADYGGAAVTFVNASGGQYKKTTGTTHLLVPFSNSGAISVTGGSLLLHSGGTFLGGSSATASGSGVAELAGGVLTTTGNVTWNNFNLRGGELAGTQSFIGSDFTWFSGDWNTSGTTTIAANSTFAIASGVDHDFSARAIVNDGTVNWTGGRLRSGNGGTITNNSVWNDSVTSELNNDYNGAGGTTFVNSSTGQYLKLSGVTNFLVPLVNHGNITVSGGALNLQSGGTFADGSIITSSATAQLLAGTLTASGNVTVSNFLLNGGRLDGNQTFKGTLSWLNGDWNTLNTTTVGSGATLTIGGTADHDFSGHTIVNQGTINWTGGRLRSGNGGTVTNHTVWNDSATSEFNNDYNGAGGTTFVNNGTYNKTAGTTNFLAPLINVGTVNVSGGTLNLQGGGTFADGSTLTNTGTAQLLAGTLTASGNVTVSNFLLNGGRLDGNQTFKGTLSWLNGDWNTLNTTTVGSGTTLTIGGTADHDFSTHAIVNNGTINWTGGRLRSGNGGTVTNHTVWNDSVTSEFNNDYNGAGGTTFVNNGTYNKTAGTTNFLASLVNVGTINVSGGTLNLHNGATFAEGSTLTNTGTAQLLAGTLTASGNVTVSNFLLNGGRLDGNQTFHGSLSWLNGDWNTVNTTTIGSDATLTIDGGADHDFSAHAIVNNGTVNWTGGRLRSGNGGSIVNAGVWNSSLSSDLNNDYQGAGGTNFTNSGTYNKTGNSATTTISVPFSNSGAVSVSGGTQRFASTFTQTSGTVSVSNGATIQFDQNLNLSAGNLLGSGTIVGDVSSAGIISPSASSFSSSAMTGQLAITGNLTLSSPSSLLFHLGGTSQGTSYDFLSVSGTTSLGGAVLNVGFTNGFVANSSQTFTLLNSSALNGSFFNVASGGQLFTADGLGSFQVDYGAGSAFSPTSVVLSNFLPIPEPSTYALLGLGLLLVVTIQRQRRR